MMEGLTREGLASIFGRVWIISESNFHLDGWVLTPRTFFATLWWWSLSLNSINNFNSSQLKQDIKAELGDLVGEDTIKTIEQVQADTKLAQDLKDQTFDQAKSFGETFQEIKQEIPAEVIGIRWDYCKFI